jgi:hypothetical protein
MVACGIWFRRNKWLHEGIFKRPNEVYLSASSSLEDFRVCNSTPHYKKKRLSKPFLLETKWLKLELFLTKTALINFEPF